MPSGTVHHLRIADAHHAIRHVFVRDLVLDARIGVHRHEKDGPQTVRINVDLSVLEGDAPLNDSLANAVCYEQVVAKVESLVGAGHINLVETLAERIAAACLEDVRVIAARVRVEKLNALPNAASVGVEIERHRPQSQST